MNRLVIGLLMVVLYLVLVGYLISKKRIMGKWKDDIALSIFCMMRNLQYDSLGSILWVDSISDGESVEPKDSMSVFKLMKEMCRTKIGLF